MRTPQLPPSPVTTANVVKDGAILIAYLLGWAFCSQVILKEAVGVGGAIPELIVAAPFFWLILRVLKSKSGQVALAVLLLLLLALLIIAFAS